MQTTNISFIFANNLWSSSYHNIVYIKLTNKDSLKPKKTTTRKIV